MSIKKCFRCGEEKDKSEFYRHPKMADGFLGKCRECAKSDIREYRVKNLEKVRALDRAKAKSRVPIESIRKQHKNYAKKFPVAVRAHQLFRIAFRKGMIEKKNCEVCGSEKSQGHHEDYYKPLAVIWLCPLHHKHRHLEIKAQGINLHASL